MTEQPKQPHNFDNKSLTLVTTALIAASNLLKDPGWVKTASAASPVITFMMVMLPKIVGGRTWNNE